MKKINKNNFNQMSIFDIENSDYIHINKEYIIEGNTNGALIAESFGIQGGYVNKIADITIPKKFDVIYVTGESGSGKTTILKEIMKHQNYCDYHISDEIKNKPIFLAGGVENQQETIGYLTSVGLSDATMWLNNYYMLSDSQQARFEIAIKMMNQDIICVDEFLSTLDRKTALPVAYSIQKAIRRSNKKLIVTTAHSDLGDYLKPDITIYGKAFPSTWMVYENVYNNQNPILEDLSLKYVSKDDYRDCMLAELHYKGKYTGGTKEYLFAYYKDELIGLLVSTFNMHTNGRRISRVVVHPSYRGCGVAKSLIQKYITDFPNTDVIATMALFNPCFERAGMKRIQDTNILPPKGLKEMLKKYNFDETKWGDIEYLIDFCDNFNIRKDISKFAQNASNIVIPAGKRISVDEIKNKIQNEQKTASRVLYGLRPRTMAKYINY